MVPKMMKFLIPLIIALVLLSYMIFKPEYELFQTIESPDKKYILELYIQKKMNHIGFSSQHSHKKAYVILKNSRKQVIIKPDCKFPVGDFMVSWRKNKEKVYFSHKNYIDISKGSYFCLSSD